MCEQVLTVNKGELAYHMFTLGEREMAALDGCLLIAMGLMPVPA